MARQQAFQQAAPRPLDVHVAEERLQTPTSHHTQNPTQMIRASGGKAETLGGWGLQGSTGVTLTISNQATVSELWQQKHKKVK